MTRRKSFSMLAREHHESIEHFGQVGAGRHVIGTPNVHWHLQLGQVGMALPHRIRPPG